MLIECAIICKDAAIHIKSDPQFIHNLYALLETIRKRCAQDCNLFKDNYYSNCTDICSNCPNNISKP
ncbi:hypothetical protein HYG86_07415 [Alkalicella caledoniensis]|uniref:HEPN domain-containing protein n=1 Tax=Alkalicella caledoniensis TaxID=2731377 RepID=A0A7G9W7G1_ALKCA|nr:hypothetical protein [Alkalicella caledoniensis]QNO14623.1 hypothetical protein HYG86_07415 [Alkalicella caledoniensis]